MTLTLLYYYKEKLFEIKQVRERTNSLDENITLGTIKSISLLKGSDTYLNEFISSFNKSIYYQNNTIKNIKSFNSNIAHELKSPLTLLQMQLEMALLYKDVNIDKSIKGILEKLHNLDDIIEQMLLISNDRLTNITQDMRALSLSKTLLNVLEEKKYFADNKSINLYEEIEPVVPIHGNPLLLKYAIANLLDNAIKYTLEDGSIKVYLRTKREKYYIIIKDNGIGINRRELALIFHPYYRGNNDKIIEGYGLGLTLSTWIFNLHGATVKMRSQKNRGTLVLVKFTL